MHAYNAAEALNVLHCTFPKHSLYAPHYKAAGQDKSTKVDFLVYFFLFVFVCNHVNLFACIVYTHGKLSYLGLRLNIEDPRYTA